jgi:hypothetical protein
MKKIIVTVDFDAEVPDDCDADEQADMTCDIPFGLIKLQGNGRVLEGCVKEYTTQNVEEAQ